LLGWRRGKMERMPSPSCAILTMPLPLRNAPGWQTERRLRDGESIPPQGWLVALAELDSLH
jgi:hypothetical protein